MFLPFLPSTATLFFSLLLSFLPSFNPPLADQISYPDRNHGFWLRASSFGGDDSSTIDIATPESDEVLLRPRLSVSCHGDLGKFEDVL